ncbi:MAG: glycine C-acetyltransferase, partial [Verrucomicrobiales bacterium]|nr:glycine C-acetyltransferase [Verrucomicrobiales bacterium]
TADTILYAACFDANGGLFEPLLTVEDAIISDALNHASIIDGIRLCKAKRFRYKNRDTTDLETQLKAARADGARHILIATDGAFSMDGTIAPLAEICALAERYDAQVMIDDCHSTGFLGETGRGTPEHTGTTGKVDIITGTLGKALGGASGGFTSGPQEVIDSLRQRSRPYLFSNTLAPPIAAASLKVLELLTASTGLRDRLADNTRYYTDRLRDAGFDIGQAGQHPIVPVMLGDAKLAQEVARRLLDRGVYAIGFFFPVVPRDTARIRTQVSAAHTREHLDTAVDAFAAIKSELGF